MSRKGAICSVLLLFTFGCAVKRPLTYRLTPQDRALTLVPPGMATPTTGQAIVAVNFQRWDKECTPTGDAIQIAMKKARARLTVNAAQLTQQPPAWLAKWTTTAELRGCLPAGGAAQLAGRILESVPLDPAAAYRLMHDDSLREGHIDIGSHNLLQTTTPLTRTGVWDPDQKLETVNTTGDGGQLNVELRSSANLLGVENAWYALQPRPDGVGSRIVLVSAERNLRGAVQPATAMANHFQFAPEIAFYRLFYKKDPKDNGNSAIILGARTPAELDQRSQAFLAGSSSCAHTDPNVCMVVPRSVGVNPYLAVTVNGAEVRLSIGSSVRQAISTAGGPRRVEEILPQLQVSKPHAGKLVTVDFDRQSARILDLRLLGGESITWR